MANTFVKISNVTVSSATPTITFSSIPQTYTDLVLQISVRGSNNDYWSAISFNGSSSNFVIKQIQAQGSSVYAQSNAVNTYAFHQNLTSQTANVFASSIFYIPNYAGATNKSFSGESVQENNASESFLEITGGLWSNTAAITSITLTSGGGGNYVQYSTATLYGIKSS